MKTILLIEDDPALLPPEQTILGDPGYAVDSISGSTGRTCAR